MALITSLQEETRIQSVFNHGDFVVEYRGELIDAAEAEHRRKLYHNASSIFMFDFMWKWKTWCEYQHKQNALKSVVRSGHC
ncbi:hypothetical protein QQF64_033955 [Cirrhinus molitorella]|uniref:Uncharacterized protein n=1 Tax=Cirrhinus molitorella TaxID=172907 RepID=A0ABR3MVD3_9TELE